MDLIRNYSKNFLLNPDRKNNKGNAFTVKDSLQGKNRVVMQPAVHEGFFLKNELSAKENRVGIFFEDVLAVLFDFVNDF